MVVRRFLRDWEHDGGAARFVVFCLFIALVFATGGGSRGDIESLVVLRPLAVLFAGLAVLFMTGPEVRRLGVPAILLALLALVQILQLVPLPQGLWSQLPKRDAIAAIGTGFGFGEIWRPLTLAPVRTLNSLFSLTVPVACLLLVAIQKPQWRRRIMLAFLVAAAATALWAALQLSGPVRGPLYLYRITNGGEAVGLFANRNHQAVFVACGTVIWAWYLSQVDPRAPFGGAKAAVAFGAYLSSVALLVITGSRSGLLLELLLTPLAVWFLLQSEFMRQGFRLGRMQIRGLWLVLGFVVALALLIVLMLSLSRSMAIDRFVGLVQGDEVDELRTLIFGILLRMIADFMPFGSGFGSFEYAFQMYEPVDILTRRYVNQAHNDLAQFLIEGGLFAAALLAAFGLWLVRRVVWIVRRTEGDERRLLILCASLVVALALASLPDYPLRTPSLMTFLAALCGMIEASWRDRRAEGERA